jgi:YD repeat-containing protein
VSQSYWIGTGGRVDSAATGGSGKMRYTYDSLGRVTLVKDANGDTVETRAYLEQNGNLSAITGSQRSHRYDYDAYGQLISDSIVGIGKRSFEYDVLNRQKKVWDGLNTNPTEFVYDSLYLTKVIDPKGQDYQFGYNAVGWATWNRDPAGGRDSVWYSRDGEVTRTKNRRNQFIRFAYDDVHRLVKQWRTAAPADTAFFTYNTGAGANRVTASNPYDTVTTYVSNHGLVDSTKTVFGGRTYTIRAKYTSAGWLDSVTAAGSAGSFLGRRYLYNSGPGTVSEIRLGGKSASLSYNNKLQPTSTTFTGGAVTWRDFIIAEPVARVEPDPDYPNLANFGRRLEHQQGRIRSHFRTGGSADLGNFFGYDKLDRIQADTFAMVEKDLCSWDADQGWVCPAPTVDSVHVYSYDGAGNRTDLSGTYNTGNRITAFDGCSYATDTTGSVTSRTCGSQTVRFHWTAENWLKALKVVGGDSLDFRYGPWPMRCT